MSVFQKRVPAFLAVAVVLAIGPANLAAQLNSGGNELPNGLRVDEALFAPRGPSQVPRTPSYLTGGRPNPILVNEGRQLFVDNFLVESTTLSRTFYRPQPHPGNPVLAPGAFDLRHAIPFSDGVWFDPADHLYKMFYWGGTGASLNLATSIDGKTWIKPIIPNADSPNSNIVLFPGGGRDSGTVWMDLTDPPRKFKAFIYAGGNRLTYFYSPDGIRWTRDPEQIQSLSDRTTMFWNPFRQRWVESIRTSDYVRAGNVRPGHVARIRYYSESRNLVDWWPVQGLTFWTAADENDPLYPGYTGHFPQLYNMDAVAYESLLVGLFSMYYGAPGPEVVELNVGFSRDGFQWDRPVRGAGDQAFIRAANQDGVWNGFNTQSVGGAFLVVGDELWFYYSGRNARHGVEPTAMSTGLATLRRDGFASMDAGATEGTLTTAPLRFTGNSLFVNVNNASGQLKAEMLNADGEVIQGFTKANSVAVSTDSTMRKMTWTGGANIGSLAGQRVKVRFYLTNGSLYSFWFTSSQSGASNGYVAAGGPGFSTNADTIGIGTSTAGTADSTPPARTLLPAMSSTNPFNQPGFRITTNEAASCGYSTTAGTSFGQMTRMASTGSIVHAQATPSLASGTNRFYVRCRDTSGNSNTDDLTITLTGSDQTGESLALSGLEVSQVTSTSAVINWISNRDASAQVFYGAERGALSQQTVLQQSSGRAHEVALAGLTPNTQYQFRAVSTEGSTTRELTGTFRTTPPPLAIDNVQFTSVTRTSAVVSLRTSREATAQVFFGITAPTDPAGPPGSTPQRDHTVTLSGLTPDTRYLVRVVASEAGGGGSATSDSLSFRTIPPAVTISGLQVSALTPTSATVAWNNSIPATSVLTYGGSGAPLTFNTPAASQTAALTGLTANTSYSIEVTSRDSNGGEATARTSFKTPHAPLEFISASVYGITDQSAFIDWRLGRPAGMRIQFGTTTQYGTTLTPPGSGAVSLQQLTNLTPETAYFVKLTATDGDGASAERTLTFQTNPAPPPPIAITGLAATGVTQTSAVINWSTNVPASRQVRFGPTAALGTAAGSATPLSTAHTVTLNGLAPGTTYYFQASSTDADNRTVQSAVANFTTSPATPPLAITGLGATAITQTSAVINWSTNRAASRQLRYGNTASLGSVAGTSSALNTAHSVALTGLTANTTYYFQATGTDAENRSANSAVASFTTAAPTPPPGTGITLSNVQAVSLTQTSATITWTTNVPARRRVRIGTTTAMGDMTSLDSALSTSHSVPLTGLRAATLYYYQAESNGSLSPVLSFTTLSTSGSGGSGGSGGGGSGGGGGGGGTGYSLTAGPATALRGATVTVSWTAPSGRSRADWIALYRVGAHNREYRWYSLTRGTATGTQTVRLPNEAGQYEFRYLLNGSYTPVVTSSAITVQ